MTLRRPSALVASLSTSDDRLRNLLRGKDSTAWRAKVEAVGGCAKPVRLAGSSRIEDTTGTVLRSTEGAIFTACNNRRESVCPSCADRYATDTFHLVRCGLTGGKGIPEQVTGHVRAFVTLTAQPFGQVHNRPITRAGRVRRCACGEVHHEHDRAWVQQSTRPATTTSALCCGTRTPRNCGAASPSPAPAA